METKNKEKLSILSKIILIFVGMIALTTSGFSAIWLTTNWIPEKTFISIQELIPGELILTIVVILLAILLFLNTRQKKPTNI